MPTTVLLVRHGENDWVKSNKLAGRTPGVHLNDKGRSQSRQLSARLASWPLAAIYSSPLERCHETAAILAAPHGLDVLHCDGVLETDYGDWQGLAIDDLKSHDLWKVVQKTPSFATFPGGESLKTMQDRMVASIQSIASKHPDSIIVICSHADLIKSAVAFYSGTHLDLFQRIIISPASVSIVYLSEHGPMVERVNDSGELEPPKFEKQKDNQEQKGH